jgi:uncharacterized protein YihD (DUF1040 family)
MKKSELRQLIKEELQKVLNEEGSIKGHINDVIDELNNLPFTGSAYKKGNEIHYYLDDSNVDKEARSVKKLANSIGWKLKEDNDDILIFTLK